MDIIISTGVFVNAATLDSGLHRAGNASPSPHDSAGGNLKNSFRLGFLI
jgi:hypothetical protein